MPNISDSSSLIEPGAARKKSLILVIDDEPAIRETIREFLLDEGFEVQIAANGLDGLDILKENEFDLVITDLSMPEMDGYALMKRAKSIQPLTPVIVMTGQGTDENALYALQMGASDFVTKPIRDLNDLKFCVQRGVEKKFLLTRQQKYQGKVAALVAEKTRGISDKNLPLAEYAREMESVSISVIGSLITAREDKDAYLAGHSRRVTRIAKKMAELMGLNEREVWLVEKAAELHGIGQLIVDVGFINKPGPLSIEERQIIHRLPRVADEFLASFTSLGEVRPLIRHHHERLDGSGYPDGLSGGELDILPQILGVADCYDAMTSLRSYRAPMSGEFATAELLRMSGQHFSKQVVKVLPRALTAMRGVGP